MGITSEQYRRQNAEKMIRDRCMSMTGKELAELMDAFDVFAEYFPVHHSVELVELARLRAGYVNLTPTTVAEIMTTVQRTERKAP